jgi:uncharacterized membrane protein YdjX (TVP38/TMEM64 family)
VAARRAAQIVLILALLFAAWIAVHALPVRAWVVEGARWAHGAGTEGAIGVAFGIYLLTLLLLPIVPLNIAVGWLYGPWGALLALPAAVLSAGTAFSIARALAGGAAAQALLERPKARALADLAAEGGVLTVALIRLSPILPFTPSNAVMGLTPMRRRDILIGTAVGMAPGTVLYAWAGSLLPTPEAIAQGEALHGGLVWILLGVAFAAALVLGAAAARRLRKVARLPDATNPRPPAG